MGKGVRSLENELPPEFDRGQREFIRQHDVVYSVRGEEGETVLASWDGPMDDEQRRRMQREALTIYKMPESEQNPALNAKRYQPEPQLSGGPGNPRLADMFNQNAQPPLNAAEFERATAVYLDQKGKVHYATQPVSDEMAKEGAVFYKATKLEAGVTLPENKWYNPQAQDPELRAFMRSLPKPPSTESVARAVAARSGLDAHAGDEHRPTPPPPPVRPGDVAGGTGDRVFVQTNKSHKDPEYDFAEATTYARADGIKVTVPNGHLTEQDVAASRAKRGSADPEAPGTYAADHASSKKPHKHKSHHPKPK